MPFLLLEMQTNEEESVGLARGSSLSENNVFYFKVQLSGSLSSLVFYKFLSSLGATYVGCRSNLTAENVK